METYQKYRELFIYDIDVDITIKQEALRAIIAHLRTMNATKISRQNGTKT